MEGKEVFKSSYNYIQTLLKNSCTDNMTIDFSKLDTETRNELKKSIHSTLNKRRLDISPIIFKANV